MVLLESSLVLSIGVGGGRTKVGGFSDEEIDGLDEDWFWCVEEGSFRNAASVRDGVLDAV